MEEENISPRNKDTFYVPFKENNLKEPQPPLEKSEAPVNWNRKENNSSMKGKDGKPIIEEQKNHVRKSLNWTAWMKKSDDGRGKKAVVFPTPSSSNK